MLRLQREIKKISKLSYQDKIQKGKEAFSSLVELFSIAYDDANKAEWIITGFIVSVICADNLINEKEISFLNDVLDKNYDADIVQQKRKEFENELHITCTYISLLNKNIKTQLGMLCILFAISDGEFSIEEKELVKVLFKR